MRPDSPSTSPPPTPPAPSHPPTPNAVITDISAAGQFNIYNLAGTVDILIDINGYFVDHNHDDRYDTKGAIDAMHPKAAATGGGACNADGTGPGGPRDGQFDACSGEIVLGSTTSHTVLLVANIGWASYSPSGVKGSCRLERNGTPVPGSTITMGELVKSTNTFNSADIRLNWAGITALSGPTSGSNAYRVACREVLADLEFREATLSGIVTSP